MARLIWIGIPMAVAATAEDPRHLEPSLEAGEGTSVGRRRGGGLHEESKPWRATEPAPPSTIATRMTSSLDGPSAPKAATIASAINEAAEAVLPVAATHEGRNGVAGERADAVRGDRRPQHPRRFARAAGRRRARRRRTQLQRTTVNAHDVGNDRRPVQPSYTTLAGAWPAGGIRHSSVAMAAPTNSTAATLAATTGVEMASSAAPIAADGAGDHVETCQAQLAATSWLPSSTRPVSACRVTPVALAAISSASAKK